jgi:hypothetical protein
MLVKAFILVLAGTFLKADNNDVALNDSFVVLIDQKIDHFMKRVEFLETKIADSLTKINEDLGLCTFIL